MKESLVKKKEEKEKKKTVSKVIKQNKKNKLPAPILQMMVVIVTRGKGDSVRNFLKEKNVQNFVSSFGRGTADSTLQNLLGFDQKEKDVIFSIIPVENSEVLLDELEEKFLKLQKYAGIAFTVPLKSITKDSMENVVG